MEPPGIEGRHLRSHMHGAAPKSSQYYALAILFVVSIFVPLSILSTNNVLVSKYANSGNLRHDEHPPVPASASFANTTQTQAPPPNAQLLNFSDAPATAPGHATGTGPNLSRGSRRPDVVVFGVGDSGTRGFAGYLARAGGVHLCDGGVAGVGDRSPYTLDCKPTKACQPKPDSPLARGQASRPVRLSRAAYEAASSEAFRDMVQCERVQSERVLRGIEKKYHNATEADCFWGYKNPKHIYMLPAMREAFGDETGMILVARHPYDLCSGSNQGQYQTFGHWFGRNGTDRPSCMEFWFQVTSQVLRTIEAHPRTMRIVRIETLVLDARQGQERAGRCVGDLVGYDHRPGRHREAAAAMAEHGDSYGGRSRRGGDAPKARGYAAARTDTDARMERLAAALGYSLSAYAAWGTADELLPTPASAAVC